MEIVKNIKSIFSPKEHKNSTMKLQNEQLFNNMITDSNIDRNDIIISILNRIATDCSQAVPKHFEDMKENKSSDLLKIIRLRPNPVDNLSSFLYRLSYQYFKNNNTFIFIDRNTSGLAGLYPIDYNQVDLVQDNTGAYFYQFTISGMGDRITLGIDDVVHLKSYNIDGVFGQQKNKYIQQNVDMANANNQSITNAINNNGRIAGVLKINTNVNDADLVKMQEKFVTDFVSRSNASGIVAMDRSTEFEKLELDLEFLNEKQMRIVNDQIYSFFNINQKVVNGTYNESEYQSYLQTVVEPFLNQFSQELTYKLFSTAQLKNRNLIIWDTVKLRTMTLSVKSNYYINMLNNGVFSINEIRAMENMSPIPKGDIHNINAGGTGVQIYATGGGGGSSGDGED